MAAKMGLYIFILLISFRAGSGLLGLSDDDEPRLICLRPKLTVPISRAEILQAFLDSQKKMYMYAAGLGSSANGTAVLNVTTALLENTDGHVIILDYSAKAALTTGLVPLDYGAKVFSVVKEVGDQLGAALIRLDYLGFPVGNVHLIGHSLGAKVMGQAGNYVRDHATYNRQVQLIWALDPTGALYTSPISPGSPGIAPDPLTSSSAKSLYVLHTDPDGYGSQRFVNGSVDITANYNKAYTMQPGCVIKANLLSVNEKYRCNHDRAWRLFSIGIPAANADAFPAQRAASGDAWMAGEGDPNDIAYIRLGITPGAQGRYFLRTSAEPPYSLGLEGSKPHNTI